MQGLCAGTRNRDRTGTTLPRPREMFGCSAARDRRELDASHLQPASLSRPVDEVATMDAYRTRRLCSGAQTTTFRQVHGGP